MSNLSQIQGNELNEKICKEEEQADQNLEILHTLEMLAEKPDITIERYTAGRLLVKKIVKEKTIQIPVTLTEEVLVIEYQSQTDISDAGLNQNKLPQIIVNGQPITLETHQTLEISLYQEEAVINKKVVVTEQVEIGKLNRRIEHQYKITLQHEELDIEKQRPNSLD